MELDIAFELGAKVKIDANGKIGTVEAIWQDRDCPLKYRVEYVSDTGSVVQGDWFRANELSAPDE